MWGLHQKDILSLYIKWDFILLPTRVCRTPPHQYHRGLYRRAAGSPANALYNNICLKTLLFCQRLFSTEKSWQTTVCAHTSTPPEQILKLSTKMGLSHGTRLLGDGAKDLSHLLSNRVATSGRLSEAVCGVSSTCPRQTLLTSLLRLCITALSYSKTAWMSTQVPEVHRKAHGTAGSKGNLPLIRGERSCWRLSEGIVRPWAMLAVVSLLVCVCCCHIPESVQAPHAHLCRAAVQQQCSSWWSCISLQGCQTSGKMKEKPSSIYFKETRVQSLKGFPRLFRDLELNKAAVKFFLLVSQEWRGHCCDPQALTLLG